MGDVNPYEDDVEEDRRRSWRRRRELIALR
jgi:hypothetical protein